MYLLYYLDTKHHFICQINSPTAFNSCFFFIWMEISAFHLLFLSFEFYSVCIFWYFCNFWFLSSDVVAEKLSAPRPIWIPNNLFSMPSSFSAKYERRMKKEKKLGRKQGLDTPIRNGDSFFQCKICPKYDKCMTWQNVPMVNPMGTTWVESQWKAAPMLCDQLHP